MVYLASLFLLLCSVLIYKLHYLYQIIRHLRGFDLPLVLLYLMQFNNFFPSWLNFELFAIGFLPPQQFLFHISKVKQSISQVT